MEVARKAFDEYGRFMDQEIVAVQLGTYSVALIALTAAIRKVRPFSRFKRPNDVPTHFIEEKRELIGKVNRIDPNGGILMVKHKPLVPLPIIHNRAELPVRILGIKVSGLGISWLQSIVVGNEIVFVPVRKQLDCLECKVLLPNTNISTVVGKKSKNNLMSKLHRKAEPTFLNVGESLVKIGFAELEVAPSEKSLNHYFTTLKAAERVALKKRLGLRYYSNAVKDYLEDYAVKLLSYAKYGAEKLFINVRNLPGKVPA